jgi:hypothetical protein
MEIMEEERSHEGSKRYAGDGELQECTPGHSHGASWEKSLEQNRLITHLFSSTSQDPQPSITFHTATLKQHHLKHVSVGNIEK